ncbi:MAG: transglutaminase N-terminal domain-containing protein [Granulosicoccus sp.]
MKLSVRHRTLYKYTGSASQSHNHVCLQPRHTASQNCLFSHVDVSPEPDGIHYERDIYGNNSTRFSLNQRHTFCEIVVTSLIETQDHLAALPESLCAEANRHMISGLGDEDMLLAEDCLLPSPFIPASKTIDRFLAEIPADGLNVLQYAQKMMQHIYDTFEYTPGFSTLITPLSDIYKARKGVCQDFAHLAIAALRRSGIPTRYVSGYLETLPPPGQEKLQGADASHAWYSVFDATHGWFDFDPTNNKRPDNQYVTTAWGRDYADVTPIKGLVYGGGKHSLTVEVDVTRSGANAVTVVK